MDTPKYCSKCGALLYPGSKFCAKCGGKVIISVEENLPKEEVLETPNDVTPTESDQNNQSEIIEENNNPVEEVEPVNETTNEVEEEVEVTTDEINEQPEIVEEVTSEEPIEEVEPVIEETVEEEPQNEEIIEDASEKPLEEQEEVISEEPIEEVEPANEEVVEEVPQEEITEEVEPVIEETTKEESQEIQEENVVIETKEEENVPQEEPIKEEQPTNQAIVNRVLAAGAYVFGVNTKVNVTTEEESKVDDLLEPRKKYMESLEREHDENVGKYFDELVEQSGVDANLNSDTMREHRKLEIEKSILEKKLQKINKSNVFMVLGMFCLIFSLSPLIVFFVFFITDLLEDPDFAWLNNNKGLFLTIVGILFVFGVASFIINYIKKKKGKDRFGPLIAKIDERLQELEDMGFQQLLPLNNLFDFNILNKMMRKTTPLIKLDDHPDMNKIEMLNNKYNWKCPFGRFDSTLYMKTGSILGNPFVLYTGRGERVVNETYTGSLTIVYTKKVTIGKNTTYIPITQVLTASVTKPRPDYSSDTYLVYGSEAAPHLSFSRRPMIHKYDKKSLDKLFKEREKFIDDYAKKHPEFTPLGNDEFEDFFDGIDRDNEVEYRLLFTPLAQTSMLDIIKNQAPIGDSFSFRKNKMCNVIRLNGHNDIDYEGDPRVFMGYDLEKMKETFISKNHQFFKSMYFHFAPLMAIPLYQQYPSEEYIFKHDQEQAYSTSLLEMLANTYPESYFAPEHCHTPIILNVDSYRVNDNAIEAMIHAYGYHTVAHTEYFPKLGGDGHMHDVPVTWYEYVQIEKVTPFVIHETFLNKVEYGLINNDEDYRKIYNSNNINHFSFFKGYFTFIKNDHNSYNPSPLNELIKEKLENK